jgi:hypothetical protein
LEQGIAEVVMGVGVVRINFHSFFQMSQRLIGASEFQKSDAESGMNGRLVRIDAKSVLEMDNRFFHVSLFVN